MNFDLFHNEGYQVVKKIVPDDLIIKTKNYLEEERNKTLEIVKKEISFATLSELIEKAKKLFKDKNMFNKLNNETKMALSGHFRLEARLDEITREVPAHPDVQNVLRTVLKSNGVKLHMPPTARFILPMNTLAAVPPHQDVAYNRHVSDFIIMWVPFVQIDDDCGGVVVHHGTGHIAELPTESEGIWLKGVNSGSNDLRHCKMSPGDILLMNKYVVHESKGNMSNRTRYSIDYRLFDSLLSSKKHSYDFQKKKVLDPEN